jgi:4a-hydroxytetrahydrobiopterin dehydratase
MIELTKQHCVPCEGGTVPLTVPEAEVLQKQVNDWKLSADTKSISKEFKFKNFVEAMDFANKITPIAEGEGHHPDLSVGWGKVGVELTTHAIKGLSINDFILASKIDQIAH